MLGCTSEHQAQLTIPLLFVDHLSIHPFTVHALIALTHSVGWGERFQSSGWQSWQFGYPLSFERRAPVRAQGEVEIYVSLEYVEMLEISWDSRQSRPSSASLLWWLLSLSYLPKCSVPSEWCEERRWWKLGLFARTFSWRIANQSQFFIPSKR